LALTSPTGGGRSFGIVRLRTEATEFVFVFIIIIIIIIIIVTCTATARQRVGKQVPAKTDSW
jgi:hypothetical protein